MALLLPGVSMSFKMISLCLFLSLNCNANCDFYGYSLSSLSERFDQSPISLPKETTWIKFSKAFSYIGEFDQQACSGDALATQTLMDRYNHNEYLLIYTQTDECDGGNSYGIVFDQKMNFYAVVQDYDFYCLP